jgi:hypothetical protein
VDGKRAMWSMVLDICTHPREFSYVFSVLFLKPVATFTVYSSMKPARHRGVATRIARRQRCERAGHSSRRSKEEG